MKDSYSFDLDYEGARRAYNRMFVAYLRTFARMGLKAIPMAADTGPIGGDLSHEFIILADTGESEVFCHADYLEFDPHVGGVDYDDDLQPVVDEWTRLYAATDDKHDADAFASRVPGEKALRTRGIEVGHIFHFGAKYSEAMGATVQRADGSEAPVEMGSYGIGVSRLVGAIIEACHDDAGIVWPESVAPFRVGLINLKMDDPASTEACERLYSGLSSSGVDVLYDDTDERAGVKFATSELIGTPWRLVVGPRGVASGVVELKSRVGDVDEEIPIESAVSRFAG